jgi:hypothetical protein
MSQGYDTDGNLLIGGVKYGNHDIAYPDINYVTSDTYLPNFASEVNAGLLSQGAYMANCVYDSPYNIILPAFSPNGVVTNDFYRANLRESFFSLFYMKRYNDFVEESTGDIIAPIPLPIASDGDTTGFISPIYKRFYVALITPDANALIGCLFKRNYSATKQKLRYFFFMGQLEDVNPNLNYYDANRNTKSAFLVICNTSINTVSSLVGFNYIGGTFKAILTTGDGLYALTCNFSDLILVDNDSVKGNPGIGRVPGMKVADTLLVDFGVYSDQNGDGWLVVGNMGGTRSVCMKVRLI